LTNPRPIQAPRLGALAVALAACAATAQPGGGPHRPIGTQDGTPNVAPPEQEGVGVTEHLGDYLPLELPFIDSTGAPVTLAEAFADGRPVILALVYYDCPVVCAVVMGKLTEAFRGVDFAIGEDYNVVFASIDPTEQPPLAASVKERYLAMYGRPAEGARAGWWFLTSPGDSAALLADRVGWEYKPLADGEFSHPVAIFVCTPEGRIARYIYGVGYEPKTMRMALLEASDGKISESIGDFVRMFCFRFDPTTGKYSLVAYRVVQLGGLVSIAVVGGGIGLLLLTERLRRRRGGRPAEADAGPNPKHAPGSTA
jgi:protein SCO1